MDKCEDTLNICLLAAGSPPAIFEQDSTKMFINLTTEKLSEHRPALPCLGKCRFFKAITSSGRSRAYEKGQLTYKQSITIQRLVLVVSSQFLPQFLETWQLIGILSTTTGSQLLGRDSAGPFQTLGTKNKNKQ
jgi:hypothetical protein